MRRRIAFFNEKRPSSTTRCRAPARLSVGETQYIVLADSVTISSTFLRAAPVNVNDGGLRPLI